MKLGRTLLLTFAIASTVCAQAQIDSASNNSVLYVTAATPSATPQNVSDASARLSLPANTAVGTKVHQVDNDTIYQLVTVPAVTLSGSSADGVYTKRGTNDSRDYYNLVGFDPNTENNVILWTTTSVVDASHHVSPLAGWAIYQGSDIAYTAVSDNLTVGLPTLLVDGDPGQVRIRQGFAGIDLTIQFNSSLTLAGSDNSGADSGDAEIIIGTMGSPTRTQIAAKIAALTDFPPFSPNLTATSSGEQITFHQPFITHMEQFFINNEGSWVNVGTTYTPDDRATPDLVTTWYSVNDVAPASIGVALSPTYKDVSLEECWIVVP